MENPICDERFYFDEYKPTKEELSDAETEQTWRRLSSSDSFDEQNSWTPPTTNIDSRYFGTKAGQECKSYRPIASVLQLLLTFGLFYNFENY